jgi:hypothetical protein
MEANKNFAKWLSCGIQISGTFGLHHVNRFAPLHNLSNLNEDSNAVKVMEEAIEVNGIKKWKSQSSNLDNKTKPS